MKAAKRPFTFHLRLFGQKHIHTTFLSSHFSSAGAYYNLQNRAVSKTRTTSDPKIADFCSLQCSSHVHKRPTEELGTQNLERQNSLRRADVKLPSLAFHRDRLAQLSQSHDPNVLQPLNGPLPLLANLTPRIARLQSPAHHHVLWLHSILVLQLPLASEGLQQRGGGRLDQSLLPLGVVVQDRWREETLLLRAEVDVIAADPGAGRGS